MELEPTVSLRCMVGGYVVRAITKCPGCNNEECTGWLFTDHIFTDIDLLMNFVRGVVIENDAKDIDSVEQKLRKK